MTDHHPKQATEPDTSQDWASLDGGTAFHLIQRHCEDWGHAGRMMEAWKAARSTPMQEPARLTDERIDAIAAGIDFLKGWGWRQYARAIIAAHQGETAPEPVAWLNESHAKELLSAISQPPADKAQPSPADTDAATVLSSAQKASDWLASNCAGEPPRVCIALLVAVARAALAERHKEST